jgi:hypothetical protein
VLEHQRQRDRLLQVLLLWTAITTLVLWLPAVRGAFDGASYQWNNFGVLITIAQWLLLSFAWRPALRPARTARTGHSPQSTTQKQ